DISEDAIENCKKRGLKNCFVMDAKTIDLHQQFDIIIASDCLEHIEDDVSAIKHWETLLKPNGTIYIFVPAFKSLWSVHDDANMHHRRYTRKELVSKVTANGLDISSSGYWNVLLFLPIWIYRKLFSIRSKNNQPELGDLNRIPPFNGFFTGLLNTENRLQRYVRFPFGVSTYCIAKKTNK
ncbi:MAG: class I SAM-dependent methyltransferase, partial [Bacteroidota bacterium]